MQALHFAQQSEIAHLRAQLRKSKRKLAEWRQGVEKPRIGNKYTVTRETLEDNGVYVADEYHMFTFVGKIRHRRHVVGEVRDKDGVRRPMYGTPGSDCSNTKRSSTSLILDCYAIRTIHSTASARATQLSSI